MRNRTRIWKVIQNWASLHCVSPPGSLLGDSLVLVTLAPNIHDAKPGQCKSGEFIFVLDSTSLEHAQVPSQSRDQTGVRE